MRAQEWKLETVSRLLTFDLNSDNNISRNISFFIRWLEIGVLSLRKTFKSCLTFLRQKLGDVEEARLVDVDTRVALEVAEGQSAPSGELPNDTPTKGADAMLSSRETSRESSTSPPSQQAETQTVRVPEERSLVAFLSYMRDQGRLVEVNPLRGCGRGIWRGLGRPQPQPGRRQIQNSYFLAIWC